MTEMSDRGKGQQTRPPTSHVQCSPKPVPVSSTMGVGVGAIEYLYVFPLAARQRGAASAITASLGDLVQPAKGHRSLAHGHIENQHNNRRSLPISIVERHGPP